MTIPRVHADIDTRYLEEARQHNRDAVEMLRTLIDCPLSHQQYYQICSKLMAALTAQAQALEGMNEIRIRNSGRRRQAQRMRRIPSESG